MDKSIPEIEKAKLKLQDLRAELLACRFHLAWGKLTKTHRIKLLKRQIAQVLTYLKEYSIKNNVIIEEDNLLSAKMQQLLISEPVKVEAASAVMAEDVTKKNDKIEKENDEIK